ncbi:nucleolar complex protein 2 homolog, partial [Ruditapes philippinarum]|uniref:nucleolar complex protein 2 homolog n=1 Tax=Ruditapes philippinarum TaxID=129788 RepID=UPI00295A9E3C
DMSGSDVSDTSDDDDTSKSDEPVINNDDDSDDEDEDDFPMSSDEEICSTNITKFLEQKNKKEIEELKKKAADLAMSKQKQKHVKNFPDDDDSKMTDLKDKSGKKSNIGKEPEKKVKAKKDQKQIENEKLNGKENVKKSSKVLKKKEELEESSSDDNDDDYDDEDVDDIGEEFDMDASDSSDDEGVHKPPAELEVMSDSNDEEEEDDEPAEKTAKQSGGKIPVTMAMIKEWTQRFKEKPSPALIHEAVYAFKAAVQHTAVTAVSTKYKVEGSKVYNAVVRMCLVEIPGALQSFLDLPKTTDLQKPVLPNSKNKRWKKVRLDVKSYLADVLKLLTDLSEANMVNVLLKHVHKLVAYYATFPKLTKAVLKENGGNYLKFRAEETFQAVLGLSNPIIHVIYIHTLQQMYMAYVRNCKFTSPNMLPMINFMQRSYVEILALDFSLAYQYAFIYIRQLAIHLRNAITTKKKESCQAVYNWQFIHCIELWSRVLSATYPNEVLEPLIYPLVQTITGTIKLIPTARYYPLRFHCVKALSLISRSTKTFIPVLPFLLE